MSRAPQGSETLRNTKRPAPLWPLGILHLLATMLRSSLPAFLTTSLAGLPCSTGLLTWETTSNAETQVEAPAAGPAPAAVSSPAVPGIVSPRATAVNPVSVFVGRPCWVILRVL